MTSLFPEVTSLPDWQLPVLQPPPPHFDDDFLGFSSSRVTNRKKGCFVGSLNNKLNELIVDGNELEGLTIENVPELVYLC